MDGLFVMSQHAKVGGIWKKTNPYVKVSGVWKFPDYVYNKVGGRWYTSFVKGGLTDRSWDDRDTTGEFGTGPNNTIESMVIQPDGKVLAGGNFTTWNGASALYLTRLNSDFSIDTVFKTNMGTGANNGVTNISLQSDGKIICGGLFTIWNGVSLSFNRLNSDGTNDTAFTTNVGTGPNARSRTNALQSDGKIIVGGQFTTWNGATVGKIVRLNSDGTRDTSFTTNVGTAAGTGTIFSVKVQSDGKILVGGNFTTWNGTTVGRIVRLNSDGTLDTAFVTNTGTGAAATILDLFVQPDGKIFAGGQFVGWNNLSAGNVVRLNSDGTRDTAFMANIGTGGNSQIFNCFSQSDGKIYLGGDFTLWNGSLAGRIVRLNSDGTRDTSFTNIGANSIVYSINQHSDGKVFLGGAFQGWDNKNCPRLLRLNTDGTAVETPTAFANSAVSSIAVQSDGKILVGGFFTFWNGVLSNRIVRLNFDGTRDSTFGTNVGTAANTTVYSVAVQSDGKILVGGAFATWGGVTVNRIVRLNSDGTRDTTFTTNTGTASDGDINTVIVQTDQKILIGGAFTTWNGVNTNRIVRLNSDGTRDSTFTTGTGPTGPVSAMAVQSNGSIVVGGSFSSWAGTVGRIVRISSNGSKDSTFTTNNGTGASSGVSTIAIQADGKILVGGAFPSWNGVSLGRFVRLNSDGTRDTTFTTNNGTGANLTVSSVIVQTDQKILIGGQFTTWNGVTVNRIVRLNSDGTRDTAFTTNMGSGSLNNVNAVVAQPDNKVLAGGTFTAIGDLSKFRRFFVRIGGEDAS